MPTLEPYAVEWGGADRGRLESQQHTALAVVRYEKCRVQLLASCRAKVGYRWSPTELKREGVILRSKEEIHARAPLGAASLEAKLAQHGELALSTTLAGRWEASSLPSGPADLVGECEGATHVVGAVAVGAFELSSAKAVTGSANASVLSGGGAVNVERAKETLSRDGDPASCAQSSADGPPRGCGALIRLELVALSDRVAALVAKGWSELRAKKFEAADETFRHAVSLVDESRRDDLGAANALYGLGEVYRISGRQAQAQPFHVRALAIRERLLPPGHLDIAWSLHCLGEIESHLGKDREADTHLKSALAVLARELPPDHDGVAWTYFFLGENHRRRQQYAEAEPFHRAALELRTKLLLAGHVDLGWSFHALGDCELRNGKHAEAEQHLRAALAIHEKAIGESAELAHTLMFLGESFRFRQRYAEAEPIHRRALTIRRRFLPIGHLDLGWSLHVLGDELRAQKKYAEADIMLREALPIIERGVGPEHDGVAWTLVFLAETARALGKQSEGDAFAARAEKIRAKTK